MASAASSEPRDVLVALLPEPPDLELALSRRVYRVRRGKAFDRLGDPAAIRRIAFYQPDSFGRAGRRIEFWADVRGCRSAERRELLPGQPDHIRSREQYHVFDLEPLRKLARPIVSGRGRRLLFVRTTAARLQAARELNELFAGTPPEEQLFRALRELGLRPEREWWAIYSEAEAGSDARRDFFLDFAVFCRERDLNVECDGDRWHSTRAQAKRDRRRDNLLEARGWHILRYSAEEIDARDPAIWGRVREAVDRYGGEVDPAGTVRKFRGRRRLQAGQLTFDLFGSSPEPERPGGHGGSSPATEGEPPAESP